MGRGFLFLFGMLRMYSIHCAELFNHTKGEDRDCALKTYFMIKIKEDSMRFFILNKKIETLSSSCLKVQHK
jgi:hypothetical protein